MVVHPSSYCRTPRQDTEREDQPKFSLWDAIEANIIICTCARNPDNKLYRTQRPQLTLEVLIYIPEILAPKTISSAEEPGSNTRHSQSFVCRDHACVKRRALNPQVLDMGSLPNVRRPISPPRTHLFNDQESGFPGLTRSTNNGLSAVGRVVPQMRGRVVVARWFFCATVWWHLGCHPVGLVLRLCNGDLD